MGARVQGAKERVRLLRESKLVDPSMPVVAVEGFVVELMTNWSVDSNRLTGAKLHPVRAFVVGRT